MAQNHGGHLENHLGGFAAEEARDVIERIFLDDSPFMILSPNRSIRIVSGAFFHDISGLMAGRRQYPFHLIEPKWQCHWTGNRLFAPGIPAKPCPPNILLLSAIPTPLQKNSRNSISWTCSRIPRA